MPMQVSVPELADELKVVPGQVEAVLEDLGVPSEHGVLDLDGEALEMLRQAITEAAGAKQIRLLPGRTPRDIATAIGVADNDVLKALSTKLKVMATLTTTLENEVSEKLAQQFGYDVLWGEAAPAPTVVEAPVSPDKGVLRPPVVTILGHVDHGKTTLLDFIRKTNVVDKEHGGITQHIGAYQVELKGGTITFLDTPGHAAFTAMRARGAAVTDIAIIVIAADDGIMPQTIEAISHVKSADVPIIVAINKCDRPEANPDRVMQQLTEHELIPEAYGGQVITVNVSAITGDGIDQLLEMILLQAEVLELKAEPKGELAGVVIEAQLERGRGPVATVLIQNGTLRRGDIIVLGDSTGKVRAMTDHQGVQIKEALPAMPVEVLGLDRVPKPGDKLEQMQTEKAGRAIAKQRLHVQQVAANVGPVRKVTLRDIANLGKPSEITSLRLIIKSDVQGSVEAVKGVLDKLNHDEVDIKILHSGVGSITENDILLAGASGAICVGFNVKPEGKAKAEAVRQHVEIRTYKIIYELVEDIEAAMKICRAKYSLGL